MKNSLCNYKLLALSHKHISSCQRKKVGGGRTTSVNNESILIGLTKPYYLAQRFANIASVTVSSIPFAMG